MLGAEVTTFASSFQNESADRGKKNKRAAIKRGTLLSPSRTHYLLTSEMIRYKNQTPAVELYQALKSTVQIWGGGESNNKNLL